MEDGHPKGKHRGIMERQNLNRRGIPEDQGFLTFGPPRVTWSQVRSCGSNLLEYTRQGDMKKDFFCRLWSENPYVPENYAWYNPMISQFYYHTFFKSS